MKRDLFVKASSFPLVLLLVAGGHYFYDLRVLSFCNKLDSRIMALFQVVTDLGLSTWYLIAFAVLFLYFFYVTHNKNQSYKFLYLFCVVAASGVVTNIIKWFMGRWRPKVFISGGLYGFQFLGVGYEQTSFPSGHATTICSLSFALSYLFPQWRWFWIPIALMVCMSRVAIGAHYLSDVIMGAYIGIFVAFLLKKWPLFENNLKRGLRD
jgi:membrane-associated phospholipid phosphatase